MIVNRLLAYLGSDRVEVTDDLLAPALAAIGRSVKRNLGEETDDSRSYISASAPWYCPTRMFYMVAKAPRTKSSPRSRVTFLAGDVWEAIVVLLMRLSGVELVSPDANGKQHELSVSLGGIDVPVHPDASIMVPCRLPDGTDGWEEAPVEVKSMAAKTFAKFREAATNPAAEWWDTERWAYLAQIRLQMRALGERQGLASVSRGIFIGVCKDTGHLAELHVPFDPVTFSVFDRAVPATHLAVKRGTPPARPAWATAEQRDGANELPGGGRGPCLQIKHWRCRFCPFVRTCWAGFDLVPLPSGPEWRKPLTTVTA